jgi:hypothetical protein
MAELAVIERYVGLPYKPGEFDCADLVRQVQQEVFGRAIALPQDRNRPVDVRGQLREITHWLPSVARRRNLGLATDRYVQDGDGVLLQVGEIPRHIGVACWLGVELWVLHNNSAATGSVLTRWRDLRLIGFGVEGVYAWI